MKKIVSNVFYYFLDALVLTILGYLFWILMGRFLTKEEYGILFTIISFSNGLALFSTLGFQEALPKFIPEFLKKGKKGKVKATIKFSIKVIIITSLIISFLIFYFSKLIALNLYNSEELALPLKYSSILIFVFTLTSILKSTFQGFQNFKSMFLVDSFSASLKILIALLLTFIGFKVLGGVFAWISYFLSCLILYSLILSKMSFEKENSFDKKIFLKFCSFSLLSSISSFFILQGGIIISSFLSTFGSVGLLSVAYLFGMITLFIPSIIAGAIFPSFSEFWVREKEKVKLLLTIAVKTIVVIVLPLIIFLSIFSKFFVELFFGSKFLGASLLFAPYLLAFFLMGISSLLLLFLYSAYKPKIRLLILFFGMLLNIILCFLLIPLYDVLGAVFSFLTSQIFIISISIFFVNKVLPLKISRRSIFLIPNNIIFLIILLLASLSNSFLKIILIAFAFLSYFVLLFKFKIINEKDLLLLDYFPNKFGVKKFKNFIKKLVSFFG